MVPKSINNHSQINVENLSKIESIVRRFWVDLGTLEMSLFTGPAAEARLLPGTLPPVSTIEFEKIEELEELE